MFLCSVVKDEVQVASVELSQMCLQVVTGAGES